MAKAEEGKEPDVLDITSLDTYTLITMFIGILTEQAWRHLGLRMDPKTQEAKKDFDKAAMAIDCIEFMAGKLEKAVSEDEAKRLRTLVADLQINFARLRAT